MVLFLLLATWIVGFLMGWLAFPAIEREYRYYRGPYRRPRRCHREGCYGLAEPHAYFCDAHRAGVDQWVR